MIDERYDRDYQAGRAALNASVGSALARLRAEMSVVFEALNRIEYSAPWASDTRRCTD